MKKLEGEKFEEYGFSWLSKIVIFQEKVMVEVIYYILALVIVVTIHECSHAWVAYKLGDPTAKMAGRISLNPFRHLDVLGTLMIFIAHFGWGKPVPFNYFNLKHPRRDSALIAMAGPISNLLSAFDYHLQLN